MKSYFKLFFAWYLNTNKSSNRGSYGRRYYQQSSKGDAAEKTLFIGNITPQNEHIRELVMWLTIHSQFSIILLTAVPNKKMALIKIANFFLIAIGCASAFNGNRNINRKDLKAGYVDIPRDSSCTWRGGDYGETSKCLSDEVSFFTFYFNIAKTKSIKICSDSCGVLRIWQGCWLRESRQRPRRVRHDQVLPTQM